MPPSFKEAIHLVSGSAGGGGLIGAGAPRRNIHRTDDQLTSGPCDVDPVRHEALRRAWHNISATNHVGWPHIDLAELREVVATDMPVVLWGTRAYPDLVWIWWALDGLRRAGAEGPRFFLARPHPPDPLDTVGATSPTKIRAALAVATPITDDEWREGAELWTRYASPSPLAFDEARRHGSSAFPELSSSAELHGAWFPRLDDGRLRLSDLDELLLGVVDHEWRVTSRFLYTLPQDQLARLVRPFDAFFHLDRLRDWARLGVLEHEELESESPFPLDRFPPIHVQDRFRATERARALLAHGLDDVTDAPPLHVGGCVVNDPASPWVRVEDASGWRLALR